MDCRSKSIQSSSSSQMIWKYDVFVSFRGEDTRNNFTDHLFAALRRKGIVTFRDDTKLTRGQPISPELLQAIEGSRIFIVVFSENFAASTWCLRELAKIVDCIKESGRHILPVFYDVDPSEVRKQSGKYGKAFEEHEDLEMAQRGKGALAQVGNLAGWDVRNKPHNGEIEKIVEEVTRILGHKFSSLPNDLVGMPSRVEELEKLLDLGSNDLVRVVGICGMGGIGKTTIATVLYGRISHQYDACGFIDDVRKIYEDDGPIGAQKQLLRQILKEENLQTCNLYKATSLITTRLRHVRALIVLDNVDQVEQLQKLAVSRECLGAGSIIIIISRDKHILREHGVDEVYSVQLLNQGNALQLFCRKAFKCDDIMSGYQELTYRALNYADGLPLAIKVLGSFLYDRDVFEWRSALARLRENPDKEIMDVLRISFDGLKKNEKEIFLDIACFFGWEFRGSMERVLECCGFHLDIGIRVLIDKSLITISHGSIVMHDLLRELGRKIVREKSPKEPGKWSRLWQYKDLHIVMLEKTATENVEAVVLQNLSRDEKKTTLRTEALSQMSRLRLLILWDVNFSGSINYLSNELGYLEWVKCPLTCLPSSLQPYKLVELILPQSNIKQLWEGIKSLPNLTNMDLSHSKNLIKLPDFREIPNLERINLEECTKLVGVHPSVGLLRKLTSLNLKNCRNLVNFPNNILGLPSLDILNLHGCSKLQNNQLLKKPRHTEHLKKLDISKTAIQCQSTSSICKRLILPLRCFYSRRHGDSVSLLLPSLHSVPGLRYLNLSFCNLFQIPDAIGWLHCLEKLDLKGNNFVRLPQSILELPKLVNLNLEHCKQLKYLPVHPSSNTVLPVLLRSACLAGLYISNCPKLAEMGSRMAFSWMIQVVQAHQEFFDLHWVEIVIPGTQIPSWFNHQSMGGSMSIDPSPIWHDNNWIGVACCVAFHASDDATILDAERTPCITCVFQTTMQWRGKLLVVDIPRDQVMVERDCLWIIYFSRENFVAIISSITNKTCDLDGIKLATEVYDPPGFHFEVKKCGLHWVLKQDLEELNPTMFLRGTNSIQLLDD